MAAQRFRQRPLDGLQRPEKIMDEYVGGISTNCMTNGVLH